MHNLYKICAPRTVIYYEPDFKSFPTLKLQNSELVAVSFLKRYGYIKRRNKGGALICKYPNQRRGAYSRAALSRVAALNQSFTVNNQINIRENIWTIHWIEIYRVDWVINLLNNCGLFSPIQELHRTDLTHALHSLSLSHHTFMTLADDEIESIFYMEVAAPSSRPQVTTVGVGP